MELLKKDTKPSKLVAYRIYSLKPQPRAIAFHTRRKQFMFLEGLSVELLQLVIEGSRERICTWAKQNDVTESDIREFVRRLYKFGFFDENADGIDADKFERHKDPVSTEERRPELNQFMNALRMNGLYYSFHIDLTDRCNEKCIHCYHPFEKYDYTKELSLAEVKELVDIIYDLGVFLVTLSGGECLLRKDFFEILEYISDKGMMVNIFTNGMLLTEETVKKISIYRVRMVSISIYGDTAQLHDSVTTVPGSFNRTMDGIARLKRYQIPFEIKSIVLAENVDRVEEIRELSRQLNDGRDCKIDFGLNGKLDGTLSPFSHRASCEAIKKVFYSNPERYFNASDIQVKKPEESPCGAGKFGLTCSADGSIYPCVTFRLFLCRYKDLPQISKNKVLQQWLKTHICDFSDCFKHDYCAYCPEQCAGNNLIENGDYLDSREVSNCERAKIISEWFHNHSANKI